jgi:hypothetical protein
MCFVRQKVGAAQAEAAHSRRPSWFSGSFRHSSAHCLNIVAAEGTLRFMGTAAERGGPGLRATPENQLGGFF